MDKENAWLDLKRLRNRVNNLKRQDGINFNKEKILKNIEDPAKMWKASKEIMDWKSASSPTLIEVNNVLITRACEIAQFMNEFFINKVNKIRAEMRCLIPNLIGCRKIIINGCMLHILDISVDLFCWTSVLPLTLSLISYS